jgi:diguanylate cyclase (GGDEF)-like protein
MFDHNQLLDHLSIGIAVIDREMKILFWNRWLAEHSLMVSEEMIGRKIDDLFPGLRKAKFAKKAQEVLKTGRPVFFNNTKNPHLFSFFSGRSYIEKQLAPMEQTVILSPLCDKHGEPAQVLISIFDISDWISHQNALLKSKEEMEKLSHTDELTQIPNRRRIMEKLTEELRTHSRKKRPISLAMLDIDHFKKVNDTFGHQCGDMILHEMAQLISDMLRDYDSIGRYGGEEFLIILPETTDEQAFAICDRIRLTAQDHIYKYRGRELQVAVSIGIATKPAEASIRMNLLISEADRCLYIAKETGRNRTEIKNSAQKS